MSLSKQTRQYIEKFVHTVRTGEYHEIPGMYPQRSSLYRRLSYNVIDDLLANAYPITKEFLSDEQWEEIVSSFVHEYTTTTPYFWEMPKGLVEYAKTTEYDKKWGYPFLNNLLHFEWVEIEIEMMPDIPLPPNQRTEGDPLEDIPIVNAESRLEIYNYPVFRIPPHELTGKKGSYPLFSYRHPQQLRTRFLELSPFFMVVIEMIKNYRITGCEAIDAACDHFQIKDKNKALLHGKRFICDMCRKGVILGYMEESDVVYKNL
ncbi:putative DNA-binding domain-containing protein [Simkania negevensis]|uniref:DNA-binding domain-containing protein n=1 Tax=Simkania negevensis TaxID=83561 RepID=A0ABS3ARY7_9BACT|nr:putative DNA-binding domain-containing protein [Simkania negevensis]